MTTATQKIPVGYKETEIGVIPEDWNVRKLGDVGDIKMCRRVFNHETKEMGAVPFYKIGTFGREADAYISQDLYDNYRHRFSFPNKGDVLISAAGTIGRTIVYDGRPAYFQDSNIVWIDNNERLISNSYLFYVLQTAKYNTEGGTIQRLYNNIIKNAKFPCPTKSQQTAIVSILSDTDALIQKLEKLIEKKRNIKQGAMQELLTGKRRLPGFSGEWKAKKLGEMGQFKKGKGIKKDSVLSDGLPCIRYGEIYTHHNDYLKRFNSFISVETANESQKIMTGDLLFAGSGETAEEIGKCVAYLDDKEAYAGGDIIIFSPGGYDSMFLGFLMNLQLIAKQKSQLGQGDAVVHIYSSGLSKLSILLPPTKEEQTAIATVLSDMEAEIDKLISQLAKYKNLKQGMMQKLLTGKIRLIKK